MYVLHFGRPFWHARHYVGIALDGDVQRRLQEHLGGHGSPLVAAVVAAGIDVQLVLDVPGDQGLERRYHNRQGTRVCPRCRAGRTVAHQLSLRLFGPSGGRRGAAPGRQRVRAA